MAPNNAVALYFPQTYSFLSPETFETLVEGYISQLHIRKRNKALISQQLANDCLMVLTNPENTTIFNPKFRWWVRKHFVFTVVGELRILMDKKNGKPVCVREQLYDKVCYFHHIIGHGGRDKTFAAITKSYSKVPAELVSLFTKNCQTCLGVRKYSKNKRPILNDSDYPQQSSLPPPPHPHLGLTCNTNFSNTQHSFHNLKAEHGTLSPISPMLNHSGSGLFGPAHLHPGYGHSQQQRHQQVFHSHNAMSPHMNLSLNMSEMSLNSSNLSALSNASTPTTMIKMELPLVQTSLRQHENSNGMHSSVYGQTGLDNDTFGHSSPLSEHSPTLQHQNVMSHENFGSQQFQSASSGATSSSGLYSPLPDAPSFDSQIPQQHPLHHHHHHQYSQDYSSTFTSQTHSVPMGYSNVMTMPSFQQHHHQQQPMIPSMPPQHPQQSFPPMEQHLQQYYEQEQPSPTLTQNQMFQKQIQQEQQRFQQHQKYLPDNLMTSMTTSTTTMASMAAPSMACGSIPTPISATPSSSINTLSGLLDHQHPHQRYHEHSPSISSHVFSAPDSPLNEKSHLVAVTDLVCSSSEV